MTLVYCGQTAGRIQMKVGMQGLGPCDFVLDGDLSPLQKGGRAPSTIFCPFLFWPNGSMHQDATWCRGRPQPMGLCVRREPSPSPKKGVAYPPIFGTCLLRPNGCMDQDATWYGGRPRPRRHCVRCGPSPSLQIHRIHRRQHVSEDDAGISKHRLSPYRVKGGNSGTINSQTPSLGYVGLGLIRSQIIKSLKLLA